MEGMEQHNSGMTPDRLRSLQSPLKDAYRGHPERATATLVARGELDVDQLRCRISTGRGAVTEAGLHPMAGGDGTAACAGDMLLEALCGCAGVTLCAVATALEIPVASGSVTVEGDLDFRGTLGVDKQTPVGFLAIRADFALVTSGTDEQLEKLARLTERYCVVAQTLSPRPAVTVKRHSE
jgi:uncharacterized OsmC-like protein